MQNKSWGSYLNGERDQVRDRTLSMYEIGPEGFCGGHEIF